MPAVRGIGWLLLLAAACDEPAPAPPAKAEDPQRRVEECCADATARLEAYLGPKFRARVPVEMKTREEMAALLRDFARDGTPPDLMEVRQKLAERFHLVPRGYDLFAKEIEMIGKGAAGLYDPDADRFYVTRGVSPPDSPEFAVTVSHELVHAYRDVDKDYWARWVRLSRTNSDEALALTFLIEGDATLLGYAIGYAMHGVDPAPIVEALSEVPTDAMLEAALATPEIADYPLVLKEPLMAPYVEGHAFAGALFRAGGTAALDKAYDNPPRSTEQVLHPAKYWGKPDEPTEFEGGDPTAALGDGWRLLHADVIGEFDVRLMFAEKLGRRRAGVVAAGWDGARCWFCERAGVPAFVGAVTEWDSALDAREFAHAWADWAVRRDGSDHDAGGHGDEWSVGTREGLVVVRLEGRSVLVADGVPTDRAEDVLAAMGSARRVERKGR